jgi:hypothetical protein
MNRQTATLVVFQNAQTLAAEGFIPTSELDGIRAELETLPWPDLLMMVSLAREDQEAREADRRAAARHAHFLARRANRVGGWN